MTHDVFLSHNSDDKPTIIAIGEALKKAGLKPWLDIWDLVPGRPWQSALEESIETIRTAAVFVGPSGMGPWHETEMRAFIQEFVERKLPVIPVLLPGAPDNVKLPVFLKAFAWVDMRSGISDETMRRLIWGITGIKPDLESLKKLFSKNESRPTRKMPIELSRLPTTNTKLFGRSKDLRAITRAWKDVNCGVMGIIAMGGQGKTALVNEWLNRKKFKDARTYGWSFYSQGSGEDRTISAEPFIQDALKWFGRDPDDYASAHAKGIALAEAVCEQPTLLVLDGLEPLQYPPGVMAGLFKDQALQALLRGLARRNQGLCLISSREPLTDLEGITGYKECRLGALDTNAGVELLKHLGVNNHQKDIRPAVEEYGGHALALNLLGEYTKVVLDGDVRRRDTIPALMNFKNKKGHHAWRVMAAYANWLDEAERELLRLLGLFDRPADWETLEALRGDKPIEGLTEALADLDVAEWKIAGNKLVELGLARDADGALDCHPLVREYFGRCLREENKEAWREAHRRLYVYFKELPDKEQPDTLEEMEPLFRAVAHGCLAGLQEEVRVEVYWGKLMRNNEFYLNHNLGAFGSDLAALACFFERPWSKPSKNMKLDKQALVLSWAGFGLRALGRPAEAVEAMEASVDLAAKQENWKHAAINANNLSELELARGAVERAVEAGRRAVAFADQSGDLFTRMVNRTCHAEALARLGRADDAAALFEEAEVLQKELDPNKDILDSLGGFRYGDLLLEAGKAREVRQRAEKTIKIAQDGNHLISIGLDQINLGRAARALGEQQTAQDLLDQALESLRKASHEQLFPWVLIARAGFFTDTGAFEQAQKELDELKELLERTSFNLYWVDYHHQAARFALACSHKEAAQEHIDEMARWIEETGYGQRLKNLDELRVAMLSD